MQLYKITEQYQSAISELTELDLDADTIKDTLEGLKGDLEAKGKAVGAFIANREAEINATKEAGNKLIDRAKSEQNKMDKLKDYLLFNMETNGITEIRSPDLVIKLRKLPPSVKVVEENVISSLWFNEKTVYTLDKARIKETLKAGKEVEGCVLTAGYKVVIT